MTSYGISESQPRRSIGIHPDLLDELPDPPDNFDIWNSFPERFRERVANQFTSGIDREYDLIRDRVQGEYTVARARQKERANRAAFKRSHNLGAG